LNFRFHEIEGFPLLAWCARIRKDAPEIDVFHGRRVVIRPGWFIEGAWDGDFEAGRFDEAATMIGTGGRLTAEGVLFAAPTNLYHQLFSAHLGNTRWFSNSLTNLLVQIGDRPHPDHTDYYADMLHARMWGIRPYRWTLKTARPSRVRIHLYSNVLVRPDLSLRRIEKVQPPEPAAYGDYRSLLSSTVQRIFENAADPGRAVRYTPVAAISRGYDAPAITALAIKAGCRRAVTLRNPDAFAPHMNDDGSEIAARLGMDCAVKDRLDYQDLPAGYEAEFCASLPTGSGMLNALFEPELEHTILVSGSGGDRIWSIEDENRIPRMMSPGSIYGMGPAGLTEFRLRVGFLHFLPAFIGCIHRLRLIEIGRSPEMAPWSLRTSYNRPIPRRIAEEAGIPREWFGQEKQAGAHQQVRYDSLHPESLADYRRFCDAHHLSDEDHEPVFELQDAVAVPFLMLIRLFRRWPHQALLRALAPLTLFVNRRRFFGKNPNSPQFALHWGFERVRPRYARTDRSESVS
jgi:hypothetical protein